MAVLATYSPYLAPVNPFVRGDFARRLLWLNDDARSMGIHIQAGKGSGKSRLMGRVIAWQDFLRRTPQVILDPNGATVDNFLDKLTHLPKAYQVRLWPRVLYAEMSGKSGSVVPFPLYYRLGNESLNDIASRYLDALSRLDPKLKEAPILGWNAVAKIGRPAGIVLAALDCQVTEMPRLLDHPQDWVDQLERLAAHQPEARHAAEFFLRDYLHWRPQDREKEAGSLRVKLDSFVLDPSMRAMFGPDRPGFTWQEVVERRLTVLLDFRHELNFENRRFKMLWVFLSFLEFIKHRGLGRHRPVSLMIDELTALYNFDVLAGSAIFAADLDELINVIARNYSVWLTLSHQEPFQIDQKSRRTLMTMGTQILGVTTDFEAALALGREFFRFYPPLFPLVEEGSSLKEREYLAAYSFKDLGLFQFLVRPAKREGDLTGGLIPISIASLDKGNWNNEALVKEVRRRLSQRDGLPMTSVLAAIDERWHSLAGKPSHHLPDARATLDTDERTRACLSPREGRLKPLARPLPAPQRMGDDDDDQSTFRRKATA